MYLIKRFKKSLAIVVSITTFAWAVGPAMLLLPTKVVAAEAQPGDLIKMESLSSVYYLGADSKRYVFPNESTYFSWFKDFSTVKTISQAELESYSLSVEKNVTIREGTKMVKVTTDPKVYAIEAGGVLKWIPDEATATTLYGTDWAKRVVDVPDAFFMNYTVSTDQVTASAYPVGTLIQYSGTSDIYLVTSSTATRKVSTMDAFDANNYKQENIITAPSSITYTAGTEITAAETSLVDPSSTGVAPQPDTPRGTGLTISLASDTPAAASILSDGATTGLDGQGLIPALKLNFTAGSDGAVKVTTLKLKRNGISADADIDRAYLYNGDSIITRLAEMQSITSKVMTFTSSTGLFTVPAGSTKAVTIRFDVNRDTTSGKTIYFSVNAASDVTTDGATVSGTFPITGNILSTADVDDFGGVKVEVVADNTTSVQPGTTGFTAAHFKITPSNQNLNLEYLKLQMIGSASTDHITNIKLYEGTTQLGTTMQLASDYTVAFDLSSSPLAVSSSAVKNLYVKCDVVNGSTRKFKFSIQKGADVIVKDTGFDIYLRPNTGTIGSFTSQSSTEVTISEGALGVSRTTDSPTGNIADAATNVTFAKYSLKATGENIKISKISYQCNGTGGDEVIKNAKVMIDGVQLGTTDPSITCDNGTDYTDVTLNFTVTAGQTRYLTLVGDTTGANTATNDELTFTLKLGVANGQRAISLSTLAVPASNIAGNTLKVKTGTVVGKKNVGVGDYSSANPTGVKGRKNVRIGSFTITAGAGEDVDITKMVLKDNGTEDLGGDFENLLIKNQTTGAQIGDTIQTLQTTVAYSYEFTPSTAIRLQNGNTLIVDVYADILTNAADTASAFVGVKLYSVSATGVSTSSDAGETSNVSGQNVFIAASGTLLIENVPSSDQVQSNIVYASSATENEAALYKFKLTALTEDMDISRFIVTDTITASAYNATTASGKPTTTLSNFKLYNGDTLVSGPVALYSTSTPTNGGYIDFNLGSGNEYKVVVGTPQVLTLKAKVNTPAFVSSGSGHKFTLHTGPVEDGSTKAITARGHDSNVDKSGPASILNGNVITARKSYPVVTRQALPSSTLSAGSTSGAVLGKFNVTAVGGEIRLKKMTFELTLNDTTTSTALTLSSFKLYRNGTQVSDSEYDIYDGTGSAAGDELSPGGSATITTEKFKQSAGVGAPNTTSTRVVVVFSTTAKLAAGGTGAGEEVIGSGATNTYEVKADIANAHQGQTTDSDSVILTMLGEASSVTEPYTGNLSRLTAATYRFGVVGMNSTNYHFVWSDYSADTGSHTNIIPSTGSDWIHGYQVRQSTTLDSYIPLDKWDLAK